MNFGPDSDLSNRARREEEEIRAVRAIVLKKKLEEEDGDNKVGIMLPHVQQLVANLVAAK